jgi:hypothetical protein
MDKEIKDRFDRLEAMIMFLIRDLNDIPETKSMPKKTDLRRIK